MKIGINSIPVTAEAIDEVVEAERLGIDTLWVPEFWGYDALTPLARDADGADPARDRHRPARFANPGGIGDGGALAPAALRRSLRAGDRPTCSSTRSFARQGWGDDVAAVQRLWRSGDREAAAARVPVEIGRAMNLIGPRDEVARRVREYADAGIDHLRVSPVGDTIDRRLAALGELMDAIA